MTFNFPWLQIPVWIWSWKWSPGDCLNFACSIRFSRCHFRFALIRTRSVRVCTFFSCVDYLVSCSPAWWKIVHSSLVFKDEILSFCVCNFLLFKFVCGTRLAVASKSWVLVLTWLIERKDLDVTISVFCSGCVDSFRCLVFWIEPLWRGRFFASKNNWRALSFGQNYRNACLFTHILEENNY